MLDAALMYPREMGWRVFPLIPNGKKPLITEWQIKATKIPKAITDWWEKTPQANIGIATGGGSDFFVLDVDGDEGSKSLTALEQEIGILPDTLEAKTGTGGRHLLFQMPDRDIRNRQNLLKGHPTLDGHIGLDIRGNGGYIMVAPSIHPNGKRYEWPCGLDDDPIAVAPDALLDIICAVKKDAPEMPELPVSRPPERPGGTPVIERASLYLQECEAAIQGAGGHDALLWAARAMVIGFELSEGDALSLLWHDFNPRCNPQWDRSKPSDIKDFERKVSEARRTPGQKPRGWLLDECGLRSDEDALQALGQQFVTNILAGQQREEHMVNVEIMPDGKIEAIENSTPVVPISTQKPKFIPFPMDCFPPKAAEYGYQAAEAHCVDPAFTGLPMLVVVATAMGNAFRLKLKEGFEVPPTLWGGIVGASGTNKSGPLRAITAALRANPTMEDIGEEDLMLNPQGRLIVSDATIESVIARLAATPRGLCVNRNELAGWLKSFNAYKKSGGDEQSWLECWDANEYQLDRKTNSEELFIPAASVCIIGGIQPKVLVECFDPGKFASGLVPRLLIAHPPIRKTSWTETEVGVDQQDAWNESIMWIRTRPFASLDPNNQRFTPHVLKLSPTAKARYVDFFNSISSEIMKMDEMSQTFASKSRIIAARMALCHHGLVMAEARNDGIPDLWASAEVSRKSIEAGVLLARWFLNEQIRVYGLASYIYDEKEHSTLIHKINNIFGGSVTVRALMRKNNRRFKCTQDAKDSLNELVSSGLGEWDASQDIFTVKQ